jgi:hypothetical protein
VTLYLQNYTYRPIEPKSWGFALWYSGLLPPRTLVGRYRRFGGADCLVYPEDKDSIYLETLVITDKTARCCNPEHLLHLWLLWALTALVGLGRFFSSLIYKQSVGLLGRGTSLSQGRYLYTGQHKHRTNAH